MVFNQFDQATNMTDEISGLSLLIANDSKHRKQAIEKFYDKWKHETLVMQKWMGVQTANMGEEVFDRIPELENDDVYDKTVPNLVRSIFRGFLGNHKQFHDMSGRGYKLIVDRILEIDSINPQMAAGLCRGFAIYKKLDEQRRSLVNEQLNRVLKTSSISKNTYEVVSKILA
jgi:aminopeptidase N